LDFVELLPPDVKRQYESDGAYAYSKYVQREQIERHCRIDYVIGIRTKGRSKPRRRELSKT